MPRPTPLVACLLFTAAGSAAQDGPEAGARLELMRAAVAALEAESAELRLPAALAAGPEPLLRYSDPTRGGDRSNAANALLDAGVWRLGAEGRPAALVTVELYQSADGSRVLSFEFVSLTEAAFALRHRTERVRWDPKETGLTLRDLPGGPAPAAAAAGRLAQMRQLAKRFAVRERVREEAIECRLMAQPIDRYRSEAARVADGAVFAYANGTNPEVGLVLETDGKGWRYGAVRLTAAGANVTLDGAEVAAFEPFNGRGRTDGSYHNAQGLRI